MMSSKINSKKYCYNFGNDEISFGYLPLEIVVKILQYLPFKDVKSATVTCKHWREAINHPHIQGKFHLELSLSKIISYQNTVTVFQNSTSKYTELHIDTCYRQLEHTDLYKLIRNSLPTALTNIKCLIIDRTKITFDSLSLILSQTTTLTRLKIMACELYYNNAENLQICQNTIKNLQIFQIEKTNISNYNGVAILLNMSSNLIEFNINSTSYGNYGQSEIQLKILTELIERNSLTLKRIFLKSFEFGEAFLKICNTNRCKDSLKLEGLSVLLDHRSVAHIDEFEKFLVEQNHLKYLDICTFPSIQLIPAKLINLQHLKIFSCLESLKNFDLHVISKFKNLKILELKGEIFLQSCKQPILNKSINEIVLEMVNIPNNNIEDISKSFVNLTVLELSSTKVYDTTMQSIIKNLKMLKNLKIYTYKGSDFGVTGIIDFDTDEVDGVAISNLQNLEHLKLFYTKALSYKTVTEYFRFKYLKTFFFENTKIRWKYAIPSDYIIEIITNCPELEMLRFSYNEEISMQCIRKLSKVFHGQKRIVSRDFKNCIKIKNIK